MKFNISTTLVILAIMTVFGVGYLSLEVLKMDPTKKATQITLLLDRSGGLLPTSEVTMRGIQVGRVTGVQTTPTGLKVSINLDRDHPVPTDSAISVQNLSLVGEQYIEFRPKRIAPPYFKNGAVISADRVARSVTVSDLLAKANAVLKVIDPSYVQTIVTSISKAVKDNDAALDSLASTAGLISQMEWDDRKLLATLFGNASTLISGLDDVHAGEVLNVAGPMAPGALTALTKLLRGTDEYTGAADGAFAPDSEVSTLVGNVNEYIDMLSGPLSTFATVLEPATAPLRDYQVDAGHWLDFWDSTFNDTGAVRVQVTVPEGQR